jgi:tyrosine-protein phosphatase SIW14
MVTASMLLVMLAGLARVDARRSALSNFHQVNPQLYRGAQPQAGGLQKLKAMGVKTIVNLRTPGTLSRAEEEEARGLGLRYFNISLPGLSQPKDEQVRRVLDIINTPENQPVFVHCHHGEDRTGTIIACYRISHDGWTGEQAKKEAEKYGMSWLQRAMKQYIDSFYQRRQRTAVISRNEFLWAVT